MTATPANENPFAPVAGIVPEHVAGRKRECDLLEDALQGIAPSEVREEDGLLEHGSMAPIVLTGPRGAGKTLLLGWMKEQAQAMGIHVARLEHAEEQKAGDALANLLNEIAGDDKSLLKLVRDSKIASVGTDQGMSWREAAFLYEHALEARLRQGPMVLMMDEAHHYRLDIMGFMLGVAHRMITDQYPLVMLLAGAPDLCSYMTSLETRFYATSEDIYINSLAIEESKDALSKPFTARGIEVEPQALEMMWGMTDNYPYFVQLVGSEVWETLPKKGKRRVDAALVEKVKERISDKRSDFYSLIYDEMNKGKLTSYAEQAAETINRQENAKAERATIEHDLRQKNSGLDAKKTREIVDGLQRLGFIWEGNEDQMEAGIPSFFTYLQAKKQRAAKQRES